MVSPATAPGIVATLLISVPAANPAEGPLKPNEPFNTPVPMIGLS